MHDFHQWDIRFEARKRSVDHPLWGEYARRFGTLLETFARYFEGFAGWHVHGDRDRLGPAVKSDQEELERYLLAQRMKDDRGELMPGGGSQISLTATYGGDKGSGQLFVAAHLNSRRPAPDHVRMTVRDRDRRLGDISPAFLIGLLGNGVQVFGAFRGYVREAPLTHMFESPELFCLGNYTYIPRPLEAKLVPRGVRQEPMGEGAVLVLPNERPDALLPLCRELAGPVAELVGW